MTAYVKTKML